MAWLGLTQRAAAAIAALTPAGADNNARRALKARTSRVAGVKGFSMAASHFLDLPELERWLSEWKDALLSEAGVNWEGAILPVFIFDVPSVGE